MYTPLILPKFGSLKSSKVNIIRSCKFYKADNIVHGVNAHKFRKKYSHIFNFQSSKTQYLLKQQTGWQQNYNYTCKPHVGIPPSKYINTRDTIRPKQSHIPTDGTLAAPVGVSIPHPLSPQHFPR